MLDDWAVPPALAPGDVRATPHRRTARWTPGELARLARHLGERGRDALDGIPLPRRIDAWLATADALLDPDDDKRLRLLPHLVATSRLSVEGLTEALEVVIGGAGAAAIEALRARLPPESARGPAAVVLAANVPGLAVQTLLPALLLGRPLLLRSSRREPLFAPAWLRALSAREPELTHAFAAVTWPADDETAMHAALAPIERVVAYGGADALAALSRLCGDRLVALGPRASVALVAGAHDPLASARALARDIALLDQRGCLSVQAVYVAGDAAAFGEALAFALAAEHRRLPPGPPEPEIVARVQQLRGETALRGALCGDLEILQGTVAREPRLTFRPSPGLRFVRLHEAASLDQALTALAEARGALQGAALAGTEALARAAEIAARLALARVAPAGRLQHAEAGWASGGIDPLAALG